MEAVNKKRGFRGIQSIGASVMAIVLGLLLGLVILLISNPGNALPGMGIILKGGFTNGMKGMGQVFYFATPLIFTGLSVAFSFKTGLFNIGASGQFLMGAFVAIYIGCKWTFLPAPFHWIVALCFAVIAGGLWGFIAGALKAFCNVNEVISTIILNYIAMYIVNYLVKKTVYDNIKNMSKDVAPSAVLPKAGLDKIFCNVMGNGYTEISTVNIGLFIAVIAAVLTFIMLEKTKMGFELKACGFNPSAGRYAGINIKKNVILAMTISGALAGLGGGLLYLSGPTGRHISVVEAVGTEGFEGLSIALLGQSNPIAVIFTAVFVSYITVGGSYLQTMGFMKEVIDIILGVIIYFSAFSLFFKELFPQIGAFFAKKKRGND